LIITRPAYCLVGITCTKFHKSGTPATTVREIGQVTAINTYCMDLGYILSTCHQVRDGTKGFSSIVHIQSSHYYSYPIAGKSCAHIHKSIIEKLSFVNTYHISIRAKQKYVSRTLDRGAANGI